MKLTADDGEGGDQFGSSVSVSGDTAVIGMYYFLESSSGSAYVFTRSTDGGWSKPVKLIADDQAVWKLFGTSVSLSGDTALIVSSTQRIQFLLYTVGITIFT